MAQTSAQRGLTYVFAENIANTQFGNLPAPAVEAAKKSVIDTLGVIAGASGAAPSVRGLVELVKEAGGRPDATIVGFGGKVPAWLAAFANGAMAHCLDYDDIEHESTCHPSSAVIPAAFAIAERIGPVNGKEFITAVALGQDLLLRLALSLPLMRQPAWHRSAVLSTFASAAAAAKLLGLDREGVVDALGLSLCQSAGTMEMRWGVGTDIGGMYAAFSARGGTLSALLAQKGVAGVKSCFEGKAGLFNVYFEGRYDRNPLISDLGTRFEGVNTAFKPWPACAITHVYIDATLRLIGESKIRPGDIDRIVVYVGDYAQVLCEPLPARQEPASTLDAKFSIPFCVALAAVKGNVVIDDFATPALRDARVLEVARKVTPKSDQRLNTNRGLPPGAVEIRTRQGKTHYKEVAKPYGHPSNPVTWEKIAEKFEDCVRHAVRPLPEGNIRKAIGLARNLEQVSDVAEVIRLLA